MYEAQPSMLENKKPNEQEKDINNSVPDKMYMYVVENLSAAATAAFLFISVFISERMHI
jgi:hypothetical protein